VDKHSLLSLLSEVLRAVVAIELTLAFVGGRSRKSDVKIRSPAACMLALI